MVPLLTEEVDPESKDLNFPRATVDELVDYIDRLLEEVIQSGDLPPTLIIAAIPDGNERYNLNEIVRPTVRQLLRCAPNYGYMLLLHCSTEDMRKL